MPRPTYSTDRWQCCDHYLEQYRRRGEEPADFICQSCRRWIVVHP